MGIGSEIGHQAMVQTELYAQVDGHKISIGWLDEVHFGCDSGRSTGATGVFTVSRELEDLLDAAAAYSAETKRHIHHIQFSGRRVGRNLRRIRIRRGTKLLEEERKRRFAAPQRNYYREYLDSIDLPLKIRRAQDRFVRAAHEQALRYRFPGLLE